MPRLSPGFSLSPRLACTATVWFIASTVTDACQRFRRSRWRLSLDARLLEAGHRRSDWSIGTGHTAATGRLTGYAKALAEFHCLSTTFSSCTRCGDGDDGYVRPSELLELTDRNSLFGCTDRMAIGPRSIRERWAQEFPPTCGIRFDNQDASRPYLRPDSRLEPSIAKGCALTAALDAPDCWLTSSRDSTRYALSSSAHRSRRVAPRDAAMTAARGLRSHLGRD